MSVNELKSRIAITLDSLKPELEKQIDNSYSVEDMVKGVSTLISSKLTIFCRTMIPELYDALSSETLKKEVFATDINKNKFYALKLDRKILESYKMDVMNLESFKKGVQFDEVRNAYVSALSAVGSAGVATGLMTGYNAIISSAKTAAELARVKAAETTVSSASGLNSTLSGVLSGAVKLPFYVIIVGAVICGLLGGALGYFKISDRINKAKCKKALNPLLKDIGQEMENWIDSIVLFYNSEVEEFMKSL